VLMPLSPRRHGGQPEMAHPILLVEDDDEVREGLKAVLRTQGFDVVCVQDGLEALRALWRGFQPCVIVLDIMLPRLDGYSFREYQQANAPWRDIPVIVVSALHDLPELTEKLRPLAWFRKPLDVEALTETLTRCC